MRILELGLALAIVVFAPTFAAADATAAANPTPPSAATSAPPMAAFAATPAISNVDISPGGKMLAWLDTTRDEPRIILFDLAAQKEVRALAIDPKMSFRWLAWSDDRTLLYTVSLTAAVPSRTKAGPNLKHSFYRIFSTDALEPTQHMLLSTNGDFAYNTGLNLLHSHPTKPNTVLLNTWDIATLRQQGQSDVPGPSNYETWVPVVFEVDTHSGKGTPVEFGDLSTVQWILDKEGKVVARGSWYPEKHLASIQVKQKNIWHQIYGAQRPTPLHIGGLNASQTAVLTVEMDTDGRTKLWAIPLDGSPKSIAYEDPGQDIQGVFRDPITGLVDAVLLASNTTVWLDKEEMQRRAILERSFPNQAARVVSESEDRKLMVFKIQGPSKPVTYYLLDRATNQASSIGTEYPGLEGATLGTVTDMTYKAHDGTSIPAYLTLPPGAPHEPLPLVVLPHGGPAGRDYGDGFEWLRQFLATRGYAVFQPQFRGTEGFGDAFQAAGKRQWGLLMQDDVTDGVHALIDKGQVDPHRICIVGYAYGAGYAGYAALAGAAFTPGLYKCAISVNGTSDLPRFLGYQQEYFGANSTQLNYWRENLGERTDPALIARSPDRVPERITSPVLLLYSSDDTVVTPNQSQLMAEGLQKAGKNVRLIEIPSADHILSHTAARLQSLQEIDKFLHDHL